MFIHGEGYLVHGRMFSNMPGLDPQGANCTLFRVVTSKNILDIVTCHWWAQNHHCTQYQNRKMTLVQYFSLSDDVLSRFSHVQLCVTLRTAACQAPQSMPWSPGKGTGVGCHFLLQETFPTQGLNLCLLRLTCIGRRVLYH